MTWNAGLLRAQARFDEDGSTAPIDQAIAAGLALTSLRWNFLQTKTAGGDFSIYAPALRKMQQVGFKHYLTLFGAPYVGDPYVYAPWAEQAMLWHVRNFPGVLEAVEVWNEPNGSNWPISDANYMQLIKEIDLRRRRHSELSAVRLVGPTAGGGYMDRCIAMGLLDVVKAVSFHMYLTPEAMWQAALDHNAKLANAGRSDLRLVISEWGGIKPTSTTGSMERGLAVLKAARCGASYFPLKDYPTFPDKGLLTSSGALKSVGVEFKRFFQNIPESFTFQQKDSLTATAWSFLFKSGTQSRRIMWSTKSGGETVSVGGRFFTLGLQPQYVFYP